MGVINEQVRAAPVPTYDYALFGNPTRALSPAAEKALTYGVDALAILAARLGVDWWKSLPPTGPVPVPEFPIPPTDAPAGPEAAPVQMLPMWTADP